MLPEVLGQDHQPLLLGGFGFVDSLVLAPRRPGTARSRRPGRCSYRIVAVGPRAMLQGDRSGVNRKTRFGTGASRARRPYRVGGIEGRPDHAPRQRPRGCGFHHVGRDLFGGRPGRQTRRRGRSATLTRVSVVMALRVRTISCCISAAATGGPGPRWSGPCSRARAALRSRLLRIAARAMPAAMVLNPCSSRGLRQRAHLRVGRAGVIALVEGLQRHLPVAGEVQPLAPTGSASCPASNGASME